MEFQKLIEERRTIRKYSPESRITKEDLLAVIRAAQEAPSWKNSQTGRYYCVMSEEMVEKVSRECLPEMNPETFRIDSYILQLLQQDPLIYANFLAFPRLYRHVRLDTIQIKKNQPELFCKRLEKFLKNTRENRMYGEWHDGGRLLEK